jgi:hypothetical protein
MAAMLLTRSSLEGVVFAPTYTRIWYLFSAAGHSSLRVVSVLPLSRCLLGDEVYESLLIWSDYLFIF